jgi:hypothetical protein
MRTTITLRDDLYARVEAVARSRDWSVSKTVSKLVEFALARETKPSVPARPEPPARAPRAEPPQSPVADEETPPEPPRAPKPKASPEQSSPWERLARNRQERES